MDVLRRFAVGELAEVFGHDALAADEEARRMRMGVIAQAQVSALRPVERAVLVAYARGVNFFMDSVEGTTRLNSHCQGMRMIRALGHRPIP